LQHFQNISVVWDSQKNFILYFFCSTCQVPLLFRPEESRLKMTVGTLSLLLVSQKGSHFVEKSSIIVQQIKTSIWIYLDTFLEN
jgi:hypothetical protein